MYATQRTAKHVVLFSKSPVPGWEYPLEGNGAKYLQFGSRKNSTLNVTTMLDLINVHHFMLINCYSLRHCISALHMHWPSLCLSVSYTTITLWKSHPVFSGTEPHAFLSCSCIFGSAGAQLGLAWFLVSPPLWASSFPGWTQTRKSTSTTIEAYSSFCSCHVFWHVDQRKSHGQAQSRRQGCTPCPRVVAAGVEEPDVTARSEEQRPMSDHSIKSRIPMLILKLSK